MGLALLLTGCVLSERQTSFYETEWTGDIEDRGRFERLADFADPGLGVLPTQNRSVYMGMPDRMCAFRAENGAVTMDVEWNPGAPDDIVLIDVVPGGWIGAADGMVYFIEDTGLVERIAFVGGDIHSGAMTDERIVLLVTRESGCEIAFVHDGDKVTSHPVDDELCDPDADFEASLDGLLIGGGTAVGVVAVTPGGGVGVVADGDQVSSDPSTETWFSGATGDSRIVAHLPDGTTAEIDIRAEIVDFAARAGQLVVLTADHRLVHVDGESFQELAREMYVGPIAIDRLQLDEAGTTVIMDSAVSVQFYRLRKNSAPELPLEPGRPDTTAVTAPM